MAVSVRSIFDAPLPCTAIADGIVLGRHWHGAETDGLPWSARAEAGLVLDPAVLPPGTPVALSVAVFGATPEAPRTLRIDSPGHAPVEIAVASGRRHTALFRTPAADAAPEVLLRLDRIDSPARLGQSTDDRLLGLRIEAVEPVEPAHLLPLDLSDPAVAGRILKAGWSVPEADGVWSEGTVSRLSLPRYLLTGADALRLDASLLPRPGGVDPLDLTVRTAGEMLLHEPRLAEAGLPLILPLPAGPGRESGDLEVTFEIRNPMSPAALGINADSRPLGLRLTRIAAAPPA